jgi:cell division protein FtsW
MERRSAIILIIAAFALAIFGVIMLESTAQFAPEAHGHGERFIRQQVAVLLFGIGVAWAVSRVPYQWWLNHCVWIGLLACGLLFLCFLPGVGAKINGARRWIHLGFVTPQPSEFGKFAAICAVVYYLSLKDDYAKGFYSGFLKTYFYISPILLLIVCEVDIGTTALICATTAAILVCAGARWMHVGFICLSGVAAIVAMLFLVPERMDRMLAFLQPEKFEKDAYQAQQGLIAMGSGGINGVGLGNGLQKMSYLPYAHTDFIFPVVGEECGLIGTLGVVLAFFVLVSAGLAISIRARDRAGYLLGVGMTCLIGIQALVNLGVTTELLPNKGMPLPFISYGSSNLLMMSVFIGVLLAINRHGFTRREEREAWSMYLRRRSIRTPRSFSKS